MPGGDNTGPNGLGPRTGREAGYCAGWDVPGCANPESNRGSGRGRRQRGGGRRLQRGFRGGRGPAFDELGRERDYPRASRGLDQLESLRSMISELNSRLTEFSDRLGELESERADDTPETRSERREEL